MKLPARIAKYELQKYLGGGMSEVYQARDTVLGRTVAVKLLTAQAAMNDDTRARFLLEARVSSGIAHENIITTHDYGEEDGIPYMVLEFLTGRTLKEALHSGEDMTLRQRVSIGLQLARALAHVHSLNLIHRDVKPDNVHLDAQGRVKLMDFGIVKTGDVNLTQAGYALGTPHYVAPELVMGLPVTPSVDVYSFGVLLFEVLTGKRAIQADTVERIFYQILHEEISFAPMVDAGIPAPLQELARAATARDPAARPPTMEAVALQLENWLAANSTQSQPLPPVPAARRVRLSNWWLAGAATAAMVFAAAIGFLLLSSQKAVARLDDTLGEMVFVAEGPFLYGPEKRSVDVRGFYIDITEVTNEDYEEFSRATGHALPSGYERGKPGYPVVNVTVADAQAYAKWAGKRLPTEKEWQKAARGVDGRIYPWGDEATPVRANVADNPDDSWQHVVSADAFRHGRSPFLVLQMIGNVRELTGEQTAPTVTAMREYEAKVDPPARGDEEWYLVKGGSYRYKLAETSLPVIEIVPGRYRAPDLGFRCVKDP
ncbi:MAG: bifunctional serine/threonine-protein kinase/formylglycine-generating enzyme family protein [Bryobacteraceae bacterium]